MTKHSGSINQTECPTSKGVASIRTSSSNSSHPGQPSTNSRKDQDHVVLKNDQQQSSSAATTTTSTITDDHAASPSTDSSTPDIKPSPADQAPTARRKRALLCGVTYDRTGENKSLEGTKNDVNGIKKMLIQQLGFPEKSIRILIKEEENKNHHDLTPTKKNIEHSLKWLVEGSESGDSLVFYYSGHGGRRHSSQHSHDGITESYICCSDFKDDERSDGIIRNSYINSTIVRPLKEGVTLHAIVDACYSGNLLDLKYKYDPQTSNINEGTWIEKKRPADQPSKADHKLGTSGGLAICLSACEDDRTAPETNAFSPNKIMGSMTRHLIEIVWKKKKNHGDVTYQDILQQLLRLHVNSNKRARRGLEHLQGTLSRYLSGSKRIEKPVLSSSSSSLEPGRDVILSKKFLQ